MRLLAYRVGAKRRGNPQFAFQVGKGRSPRYARDGETGQAAFPTPLTITEDEKIVILNEVKNLVLPHLTNITSPIRSFGALRMTKIRQIATLRSR